MEVVIYITIGLAAGAAAMWLWKRGAGAEVGEVRRNLKDREAELATLRSKLDAEKELRVEAVTRRDETEKNLEKELSRLEELKKELGETFGSLSLKALTRNSEEFLKLAEKTLKEHTTAGKQELDGKKRLIDQNLDAISKTLAEVRKKIEDVDKGSREQFGIVSTLIKNHTDITSKLSSSTDSLREALSSTKKRGEWGERMAEDIIRLAGLIEGINYVKQKKLEGSSGKPDFTFFLPNNLKVNMDAKFPLDNYLNYVNSENDAERDRFRDEFLKNTRSRIKEVTTREYINPADSTVDYVLVFIPNEQIYRFISEEDLSIVDDALRQKVVLCSPFTLYAVLAVIRQAAENFNVERTAAEIVKLLGEFSKQWENYKKVFEKMGERLDQAQKEFQHLSSTRSNQLERPLRKIEDLRKRQRSIGPSEEASDPSEEASASSDKGAIELTDGAIGPSDNKKGSLTPSEEASASSDNKKGSLTPSEEAEPTLLD